MAPLARAARPRAAPRPRAARRPKSVGSLAFLRIIVPHHPVNSTGGRGLGYSTAPTHASRAPSSTSDALFHTKDAWACRCANGKHYHDWDNNKTEGLPWASGESQGIAEGGTVGLLLRRGSLSVHIGGRQVGVMCTGLSGALVWAADLDRGTSVRIARKPPPPVRG